MANRTLNTRLRLKYDTAANWATKNPVLLAGEVGIESDTLLGKVGDGEKAWQQLEYLKAGSGAVRYDIVQSLTNEQKAQARTNIGASGSDTGATSVETTGSGNAFTTVSYNASTRKITFTKGTTFLTAHQAIKTLKTDNAAAQSPSSGEVIVGSGTINLHKVSKTGNYNDLLNKLTAGSNITISEENIISAKDTTYTAGTGLSLLNGAFSVKTGYSTNGKNYKVTTDTNGNLYVNVPWTDTDRDTHYTNYLQIKGNNTEAVKFTQNTDKTLNFKAGTNVSISATSGEITISSTDTNTATAADNILDGSNSGTQITYAPYTAQQSKLSFDTSTTNPTRTDRLNLNGYLYATKLYSGGKEALTDHQNIRSINTNNTAAQTVSANETIAGSGTINLHKVSKTGSYNDLLNRPTKLSDFTDDKVVKFTNTSVAASAFVSDNNYSNYGYCASISLSGVTANDPADVYFSGKQIEQEIYASFCESYAGGVKIYAAEKPSEAVIIPLILIHK